jgi:hypothetical protein
MDFRIPDPDSGAASHLLRRALLGLLLGALAVLCLPVLRPFLAPILRAAILAYVTWPLYCRLRVPFRKFSTAAASVMTLAHRYRPHAENVPNGCSWNQQVHANARRFRVIPYHLGSPVHIRTHTQSAGNARAP